jgi:serine/threonine protein kinase
LLEGLKSGDPASVGPFRLLGVLGSGGFGRVFLGQSQDGRQAAVKVIKPELAADPEFRARFRREVVAAAKVSGRFTARVVDADVDSQEPWLATAYIPGPTLREAVGAQGPFPADSVLALAAGLAEALAAIHAAGLVHRDLKPDNVLLAYDGPRVIDFGIARVAGSSTLTSTGVLMGTLGFMSPEQVLGSAVGPPSDVFSLGSLLVFAATGEGPFGNGSAPQLLYRVANETPSLDHVPPAARPLVERCLAAAPEERPTAPELLAYLGAATPTAGWLAQTTALEIPPTLTPRPVPLRPVAPRAGDTMSLQDATMPTPQGMAGSGMAGSGGRPSGGGAMRKVVAAVAAVMVVGLGVAYAVTALGHHDVASPGSSTSPSNAASPHNAPSTPSATTQRSVASWSGGQQIDTAAELVSVSCASTKFCAAVDSGGSAYTYSGGSWSKPRQLGGGPLSWVSCPTAGSCVATSDGADTVYTYSDGTWSSPASLIGDDGKSAHLTSVSCPSVSFCMATGGRDAYVYTGASWSQGVLLQDGSTSKFTSISCSSAAFCAAVDSGGRVHTYSAGSWSKPRSLSSGGLSWVSCPTARSCVATSDGADTLYAYSGGTWSSPSPLVGADGNPAHLTSVSCPMSSFCMATGSLNAYTYSGKKWKQGQMVHSSHQFAAVSCVSANFCTAVDSGGNVYTYAPPRSA